MTKPRLKLEEAALHDAREVAQCLIRVAEAYAKQEKTTREEAISFYVEMVAEGHFLFVRGPDQKIWVGIPPDNMNPLHEGVLQ